MVAGLKKSCSVLGQAECRFLGGTAIGSIIGGVLLIETLIARKKARGEWRVRPQDSGSHGPVLSSSQVWFRSVARVVLASALASLPLILKGAFALTVFGAGTGLFSDLFIRGVVNQLAPTEEDVQVKHQPGRGREVK
jgi:hypothetical protein